MASESFGIDRFIYSTLSSDATITSLVSNRIFKGYAPQGTTTPSIVFQNQAPNRDVRAIGAIRIMTNGLYLIKAVTTVNEASLEPILNRIDELFDAITNIEPDITIVSCVREQDYELIESRDSIMYRHRGIFFQIQAQITQ